MNNSENLTLEIPSLPKGGGAMTSFSSHLGATGPNGAATLSVPLAVTTGRGYAPALSLSYSSQAGNGPFGIGWSSGAMTISRHTRHGVPDYDDGDEFLSPTGEVLVAALHEDGEPDVQNCSTLTGVQLPQAYRVSAFRPRVEQDFSRFEHWQPNSDNTTDFWVMYSSDGQVHLFGYGEARIADPKDAAHTARWLLNASVALNGEQIQYHYRTEDSANCDEQEKAICPTPAAQRYLQAVYYGNKTASTALPGLDGLVLKPADWLFILVLDYGERRSTLNTPPSFETAGRWTCRPDCHFGFEYGFALRTRRLCRQVLMFHNLEALSGEISGNEAPTLVSRTVLDYEETPAISMLRSVRQMAWETNGTLQIQPPMEFHWQTFNVPTVAQWRNCDDLEKLNGQQPYQFVDLYVEGIAGVLYQDNGAWWYREPVRQKDSEDENAIIRGKAHPLPSLPSLQSNAMLADLKGDGHLQWVVTAPGVNGHYQQTEGKPGEWLHFTPLAALPVEYQHPRAQLADLIGNGFSDLVLLGPRSVRLYRGQDEGWQPGENVLQPHGIVLPVPGADPHTLVAFSDPAGSGQQHLIQVTAQGVTWWPNLGQGRFGQPIAMPGFNLPAASFNPDQLFLADIDGSGTVDLIYAQNDRLLVWLNQCGNRFSAPFTITLPEGVRFDSTCQLHVADVQGLGVSSLLLSLPHPMPVHWMCHLTTIKPWLLDATNNNMGAHHTLRYRSSAQFWLDEKAEHQGCASGYPGSRLPFPLHLLWQTTVEDEITGGRLTGSATYRHGVWDSKEREFLGFGRVDIFDSLSESTSSEAITTPPSLSRNWYATGLAEVDSQLPVSY